MPAAVLQAMKNEKLEKVTPYLHVNWAKSQSDPGLWEHFPSEVCFTAEAILLPE